MNRQERVMAFIEASVNTPIIWGESDCTAWAAQWVSQERNHPLNIPHYTSQEEAEKLIKERGGLVNIISAELGPPSYGEPSIGDVSVVEMGRMPEVTVIMLHDGNAAWRSLNAARIFTPKKRFIKEFWAV